MPAAERFDGDAVRGDAEVGALHFDALFLRGDHWVLRAADRESPVWFTEGQVEPTSLPIGVAVASGAAARVARMVRVTMRVLCAPTLSTWRCGEGWRCEALSVLRLVVGWA